MNLRKDVMATFFLLLSPIYLWILKVITLFLENNYIFNIFKIISSVLMLIGSIISITIIVQVKRRMDTTSYYKTIEKYLVLDYVSYILDDYQQKLKQRLIQSGFKIIEHPMFNFIATKKDVTVYVIEQDSFDLSLIDSIELNNSKNVLVVISDVLTNEMSELFEDVSIINNKELYLIGINPSLKKAYFPLVLLRESTPKSLFELLYIHLFSLNTIKKKKKHSKRFYKKMSKKLNESRLYLEHDDHFGTIYYKKDKYILAIPFEIDENDQYQLYIDLHNQLMYEYPKFKVIEKDEFREIQVKLTSELFPKGYRLEYIKESNHEEI